MSGPRLTHEQVWEAWRRPACGRCAEERGEDPKGVLTLCEWHRQEGLEDQREMEESDDPDGR